MLLWKDTYGPETIPPDPVAAVPVTTTQAQGTTPPDVEPWRRWPRPPGGFGDLGCGNGLLTHILVSEGYAGYGIDLRARTSWTHYPRLTRSRLVVRALDPTLPPPPTGRVVLLPMEQQQQYYRHHPSASRRHPGASSPDYEDANDNNDNNNGDGDDVDSDVDAGLDLELDVLLPEGCFLIGNHADELTPWMPALATRLLASGYLSIPCCAWALDARFDRTRDVPFCPIDAGTLNLGGGGGGEGAGSSYMLYRIWLAALSVQCGWAVEVEVLRIPSTRNWAIVGECCLRCHHLRRSSSWWWWGALPISFPLSLGLSLSIGRKRVGSLEAAGRNVEELIQDVRKRGQFKTRRPEGKAGDH